MTMVDEERQDPLSLAEWHRLTTAEGATLDWSLVVARDARSGRRLLVVELDDAAEGRLAAALDVLAGRGRASAGRDDLKLR